jgi:steroid delta-isomerase-like uncharacterized protein
VTAVPQRVAFEELARAWISLWRVPVDWKLFDRLHADDFEDCSAAGRQTTKAAFAGALVELVEAFPDLCAQVDDLVVDLDRSRVAIRWSATGTNRRRFLGIGPTGRPTAMTGIEIVEVSDGRIVRRWGEWDITAHRD